MNEKTTVRRIKSGEKELFALLLRKYERIVNSVIYSMVFDIENTKDLTQDAFIKAYENLNSYDEEQDFKPWIIKIARNSAIDFLRKRKSVVSIEELETEPGDEKSAKNEKDRLDREKIESVLLRLKEEERTLLLMKYKEGFSNSEIAQILEMPENRINVKLFRAKEKLREYFETENRKR